jgi:hypothetical protein
LMRRHGFRFLLDPCNFSVRCDREGVWQNILAGWGGCQWVLFSEWEKGRRPEASWGDWRGELEIGSDHAAGKVLRWPFWEVWYERTTNAWFIDPATKEDSTDGPKGRPTREGRR